MKNLTTYNKALQLTTKSSALLAFGSTELNPYVSKGEMQLLRFIVLTLLVSIPLISNGWESEDERRKKQAELDYACEESRQTALAPRKFEIYKECINKFKKDKEYCLTQGDNYNGGVSTLLLCSMIYQSVKLLSKFGQSSDELIEI